MVKKAAQGAANVVVVVFRTVSAATSSGPRTRRFISIMLTMTAMIGVLGWVASKLLVYLPMFKR